jgi:DNA-binding MarR family transcriptional regulator
MAKRKDTEGFDLGYPVNLMQLLLNYYDWFDASLQTILASNGDKAFSKAQSAIFVNLAEGRNTAVEIARHLGVSKQAVNKTVGELVESGLLTLVVDAEDKRSKRILPTRAGLEKGRQAAQALHQLEQELAQRLGKDQVKALRAILETAPGPIVEATDSPR